MKSPAIFAAAWLLSLSVAVMAQPADRALPDPGRSHQGPPHVRHLTEALSLSEEQASAIHSIFESRRQTVQAQRESHRQARCAMKQEIDAEIAQVLTDDQRTLWQTMQNDVSKSPRHSGKSKRGQRGKRQRHRCDGSGVQVQS